MSNDVDPKQTAATLQMAAYMESTGDYKNALDFYRKALSMLFQTVGQKHPTVAETYEKVATILEKVGNKEGEKTARKKASDIYQELFTVLFKQGKTDEAYQMYNKSKGINLEPSLLKRSSLTSSRTIFSSASSRSSELRAETISFLDTLRGYLDCRQQMDAKYQEVDEDNRLANFKLKTDSGGIQLPDKEDQYKEVYQQQSVHGVAVKTIDELYAAAEVAQPIYEKTIKRLISKVCDDCGTSLNKVGMRFADLKQQERALEKAEDDYGRRRPGPAVSWLYDIVRGSVEFRSAKEIERFVHNLRKKKTIHIVKAKNRFERPSLTGYRDMCIHIQLDTKKGFHHICEVQLHHKEMIELEKEIGSHEFYEFFRSYFAGATGSLRERLDDLQLISEGRFVDDSFLANLLAECRDVDRLERLGKLFAKQLCEYDNAIQIYQRIAQLESSRLGSKHPMMAGIYSTIADILQEKGSMNEALVMYEESIQLFASSIGVTHPAIAAMYNNCAGVLEQVDRYDEAYEMYKKASTIFQERLGEKHPSLARIYHNMSGILQDQGKIDAAMDLLQKSLNIKLEAFDDTHESVANSYDSIGHVLVRQDKLEEATEHYEKALEIFRRTVGPAHSFVATVSHNKGELLHRQGKLDEALEMFNTALQIKTKNYGEESSAVAGTYDSKASTLVDNNMHDDAIDLCNRALAIKKNTVGENHSSIAHIYITLGNILLSQGKFEGAMDMQSKAFRIVTKVFGNEHYSIVDIYSNMVMILIERENLEEAISKAQQGLSLATKLFGGDNTETASAQSNLGDVQRSQGKAQSAMEAYEEAMRIDKRVFGDNHIRVSIGYRKIANALVDLGDKKRAIKNFNRSLDWHETRSGDYAYSHVDVLYDIGRLHVHLKKFDKAMDYFQRAFDICVEAECEDHYIAAKVLAGIAWAQKSEGADLDKSMNSYRTAEDILKATIGDDHIVLGIVYNGIGEVLACQGQFETI
ncbi:unnamed protein product [Cylindrotheca closterium]|uniref:RelA/SpoT domain-containing protein n=1 Tax=Cylindrotheca closterium TaxID=2856 RepID=A0AAD2CH58_9STRA|nr:unnamed protein product [Cylindrotheca closterium]